MNKFTTTIFNKIQIRSLRSSFFVNKTQEDRINKISEIQVFTKWDNDAQKERIDLVRSSALSFDWKQIETGLNNFKAWEAFLNGMKAMQKFSVLATLIKDEDGFIESIEFGNAKSNPNDVLIMMTMDSANEFKMWAEEDVNRMWNEAEQALGTEGLDKDWITVSEREEWISEGFSALIDF